MSPSEQIYLLVLPILADESPDNKLSDQEIVDLISASDLEKIFSTIRTHYYGGVEGYMADWICEEPLALVTLSTHLLGDDPDSLYQNLRLSLAAFDSSRLRLRLHTVAHMIRLGKNFDHYTTPPWEIAASEAAVSSYGEL